MGLAASQARYLTLSARKNDLEYASQTISSRRLQLAYKTSEVARKYSDGMNNKAIMIANTVDVGDGTFTTTWDKLDFSNLLANDMVLWGTNGLPLGESYIGQEPYLVERYLSDGTTKAGDTGDDSSAVVTGRPLEETYEDEAGNTHNYVYKYVKNPQYEEDLSGGKDIQSLLVGGKAQCISTDFATFLNTYLTEDGQGFYYVDKNGSVLTTFNELQTAWEADNKNAATGIDWRSDTTGTMKQKYYTEDDEAVQAEYEKETAEIQSQDKQLELEIKNIETQHKAIETELESVQKVIQSNIEKTFKIFS